MGSNNWHRLCGETVTTLWPCKVCKGTGLVHCKLERGGPTHGQVFECRCCVGEGLVAIEQSDEFASNTRELIEADWYCDFIEQEKAEAEALCEREESWALACAGDF